MSPKQLLKSILSRAEKLGLAQADLDLAREFLDAHDFGLCLDTVVTQVYEEGIRIDEGFYLEVAEAAKKLGLAMEKVERIKGLRKIRISEERRSLESLEQDYWPPLDEYPTPLVTNVYLLRKKPFCELESKDIRLLISQSIGLKHLVPLALDLLEVDVLEESFYYPGDLLVATLCVESHYWDGFPEQKERVKVLLEKSRAVILENKSIYKQIGEWIA